MPKVAVTSRTFNFGPHRPIPGVKLVPNHVLSHWLEERGPPGAGVELCPCRKQGLAACDAIECPITVIVEERRAERSFRVRAKSRIASR